MHGLACATENLTMLEIRQRDWFVDYYFVVNIFVISIFVMGVIDDRDLA